MARICFLSPPQPEEGMRPVNKLCLPGTRSRDRGTEQPSLSGVMAEGTAHGVILWPSKQVPPCPKAWRVSRRT